MCSSPLGLTRVKLIYLQRHQKAYVHAIYGPTDTLLYPGVDKLITSVNLTGPEPTFTFTSKKTILNDLGVSEDHFLDIGILVGFDYAQPFPPTVHEQALKATVDMVKFYKSGHAAVSVYADHPAVKSIQYPDTYARTRSMIKYSLILSIEGTVQPLPLALPSPNPPHGGNHHPHHPTSADIPTDLHEIFTHRLPDEIYYYLSRGLMSPQPLVWLASGQIIEHPPLDNGETNEYRRFVKEVITEGQTGPRATALALISSVVHSFWANRKVAGIFWFEHPTPPSNKHVSHTSQQTVQLAERVGGWHVPYVIVEEELRGQNVSGETFTDAKSAHSQLSF
jgi:Temperature dependent protein affecting M2 dsRNA replication